VRDGESRSSTTSTTTKDSMSLLMVKAAIVEQAEDILKEDSTNSRGAN